jgi:hypothetical protein
MQVRKQDESRATDNVSTELLAQIDRLTQNLAQAQDDSAQALAELQGKYVVARRAQEESEDYAGNSMPMMKQKPSLRFSSIVCLLCCFTNTLKVRSRCQKLVYSSVCSAAVFVACVQWSLRSNCTG